MWTVSELEFPPEMTGNNQNEKRISPADETSPRSKPSARLAVWLRPVTRGLARGCESQPSCANSNHRADGRGRRKNTIEEESLERQIPAKNLHFSIPGPVFQSVRPPARPPPWVNGNPPCPPPSPPPPPPPPLRHGQGRISRQSLAVQTQLYDRKNPQP